MRFTGLFFVMMAGCSWAGELATFANGSLLRVERHEALEDHVRLYLGSGYIEVHASQIKGFEPEPEAPPAAQRRKTEGNRRVAGTTIRRL